MVELTEVFRFLFFCFKDEKGRSDSVGDAGGGHLTP